MHFIFVFLSLFSIGLSNAVYVDDDISTNDTSLLENFLTKSGSFAPKPNALSYGIDTTDTLSISTIKCLKSMGYERFFTRRYKADSNGQCDYVGIRNSKNVLDTSLTSHAYVTLSLTGVKSATQQVNEMYSCAESAYYKLYRIFLQVTSPSKWGSDTTKNVAFINEYIAAVKAKGKHAGIFTNWYDWLEITGNVQKLSTDDVLLWYWHANGYGTMAETSRDAKDLFNFGPFTTAEFKQFGLTESACSVKFNVDIANPPK